MKRIFYFILSIVYLSSCSDTVVEEESPYLNGKDKTPLALVTNISNGGKVTTRAADGAFATGDGLKVYLEAVKESSTAGQFESESGNTHKGLYDLKISGDAAPATTSGAVSGEYAVSTSTGGDLYWDDFSNSIYDLRSDNPKRAIRMLYGYCYNGASNNGTLDNATGVLTGWTVASNQSQTDALQHSDLLFAKTGTTSENGLTSYQHGNYGEAGSHNKLVLPFTHAMSKITIEVNVADGFDYADGTSNKNFDNASIELIGVGRKCNVTATTATVEKGSDVSTTTTPLIMKKGTVVKTANDAASKKCAFEAVVAPSLIKAGAHFATLKGFDGNNYEIKLTDATIDAKENNETKNDAWSKKLADSSNGSVTPETLAGYNSSNGGLTLPGVNYHLTVNISKQAISVVATIKNWFEVKAEGPAEIKFSTDISTLSQSETNTSSFANGAKIDLYKNKEKSFATRSSIATFTAADAANNTPATWTYDPTLYWEKEGQAEYFRAISPSSGATERTISEGKYTVTTGSTQSDDVLWGTTAAHSGTLTNGGTYLYAEGDAISPRTKEVPLIFYHKMSKIKVVLQTAPKGDGEAPVQAVNLTGAKIQFTYLYKTATVKLDDGTLATSGDLGNIFTDEDRPTTGTMSNGTIGDPNANPVVPEAKASSETGDFFVIPQSFNADNSSTTDVNETSCLVITLSDGTTYSVQLAKCTYKYTDSQGNSVDVDKKWEEGKHYIYCIYLEKERIGFRALIKDWEDNSVTGEATMEWDDDNIQDLEGNSEGRVEGSW